MCLCLFQLEHTNWAIWKVRESKKRSKVCQEKGRGFQYKIALFAYWTFAWQRCSVWLDYTPHFSPLFRTFTVQVSDADKVWSAVWCTLQYNKKDERILNKKKQKEWNRVTTNSMPDEWANTRPRVPVNVPRRGGGEEGKKIYLNYNELGTKNRKKKNEKKLFSGLVWDRLQCQYLLTDFSCLQFLPILEHLTFTIFKYTFIYFSLVFSANVCSFYSFTFSL